jgi:hypothetical protein
MKRLLLIAALALALQGCIPLIVGGVSGYVIAKDVAHSDWCVQNVGDPSCHP